jgi:cytochrome c553
MQNDGTLVTAAALLYSPLSRVLAKERAMRRVLVFALIPWSFAAALAQPAKPADPAPAGPPDTLEQRLIACAACHGKQGEGSRQNEYYPRIAGKPATYLYNQLEGFRDGRRRYPQMVYFVRHLTDGYLHEIADYYAKLQPDFPSPAPSAAKDVMARGEMLVKQGDRSKGMPACTSCHGTALSGMQPGIPGLLGLYPDYINTQLGAWQRGLRRAVEPDCMAKVVAKLNGTDIAAISAWLAAQPASAKNLPAPATRQKLPLACGSEPQ